MNNRVAHTSPARTTGDITAIERARSVYHRIRLEADMTAGRAVRNVYTSAKPVEPFKVFVMTFQLTLTCNARYIVEELLRKYPEVDVVVCGDGEPVPGFEGFSNVRYVRRKSLQHFQEQATARVWIDNALNCTWFPMKKKDNQLYVQTWHGSMGLKTIDAENQTPRWLRSAKYSEQYTDVLLSNSYFESLVFRSTFWPRTPILEVGHARNDMFFNQSLMESLGAKVRASFGIKKDVRLALYAPTFRADKDEHFDEHALDYALLKDALEKRFGGTWNILLRSHYRGQVDAQATADAYPFVYNATAYPDIQELMAAAAVGITDYSSWICDYVLTKRPGFIFAPDLDYYEQDDRGFYYPLSATPFPVATTNEELAACVIGFDEGGYEHRAAEYLKTLGCIEDGHGAERAGSLIGEVLGSNEPIQLQLLDTYKMYLSEQ